MEELAVTCNALSSVFQSVPKTLVPPRKPSWCAVSSLVISYTLPVSTILSITLLGKSGVSFSIVKLTLINV